MPPSASFMSLMSTSNTHRGVSVAERAALASLAPDLRNAWFTHLTRENYELLDEHLARNSCTNDKEKARCRRANVIGAALLRRIVCLHLDKHSARGPADETTLNQVLSTHVLPEELAKTLVEHSKMPPPHTWLEHLNHLRDEAASDLPRLWSLVELSPWLSYVPVQCFACGRIVPDVTTPDESDEAIGISEVEPTEAESLLVRGGYFRGPRKPVTFQINCIGCGATSRWFRSSRPEVILNPRRWGRLCGEQEDLRAWFAEALGVKQRTIVPLDWDHVWSEVAFPANVQCTDSTSAEISSVLNETSLSGTSSRGVKWSPPTDDAARNFVVRLDEGIGSWTHVLAVGPEPSACACVTEQYLSCVTTDVMENAESDHRSCQHGRADSQYANRMERYRTRVLNARRDDSGKLCQAGTINGYVLHAAGFTDAHISTVMGRAAAQHAFARPRGGSIAWWVVDEEDLAEGN